MLTGEVDAPALPTVEPLWAQVLTGEVDAPDDTRPPGAPRPRGRGSDAGERGAAAGIASPLGPQASEVLLAALHALAAELRALRAEVRDSRAADRRRRPDRVVVAAGEVDDAAEWLAGLGGGA